MTTTAAELVDICRADFLQPGRRLEQTKLASAVTVSETALTFQYQRSVTSGQRLSIGFEDLMVWDTSGSTVEVERGFASTTAEAHDAGSLVTISPSVSDAQILRAMNSVLVSLSAEPGLYRMASVDLVAGTDDATYTLPAGAEDVYGVEWDPVDERKQWIRRFRVRGLALSLYEYVEPGATITVYYRTSYGAVTSATTDAATDSGLENLDLLTMGAAIRLNAGREISRTQLDTQGSTRRANEVPAFSALSSGRTLEQQFKRVKANEAAALYSRWPARARV